LDGTDYEQICASIARSQLSVQNIGIGGES